MPAFHAQGSGNPPCATCAGDGGSATTPAPFPSVTRQTLRRGIRSPANETAYKKGICAAARAAESGKMLVPNPYHPRTRQARLWQAGVQTLQRILP